jgi:hypothetical protein
MTAYLANDDAAFAAQTVAYTGTAGDVTVPGTATSILLWTTTAAYVRVGGTATTAHTPLPANTPIVMKVQPNTNGGPITVSAIQIASGGNLYAKPGVQVTN